MTRIIYKISAATTYCTNCSISVTYNANVSVKYNTMDVQNTTIGFTNNFYNGTTIHVNTSNTWTSEPNYTTNFTIG